MQLNSLHFIFYTNMFSFTDDQDLIKPERTLKRPDLDHVPRPFIKKKSNRDAYMGMIIKNSCIHDLDILIPKIVVSMQITDLEYI